MTVDLSGSLALRARAREQQTRQLLWTLGRWLLRLLAFFGLAVLFADIFLSFIPLTRGLVAAGYFASGISLLPLLIDFYCRTRWSALPDVPPLAEALKIHPDANLADFLTHGSADLLGGALRFAQTQGNSAPSARHLFAATIASTVGQTIFSRAGLLTVPDQTQSVLETASSDTHSLSLAELIEQAAGLAIDEQRPRIDEGDLLLALTLHDPLAKQMLFEAQAEEEAVRAAVAWQRRWQARQERPPAYEQPVGAGIAEDWTSGYTPFVSRYAVNLTRQAAATDRYAIYGREKETETLERWLAKQRGHNVLLVGQPGIGKQSIIIGLAQRLVRGTSHPTLRYHQILKIDIPSLLAGVSDRGEIEARLLRIFGEVARAGNVILYLEDIHLLIGGGDRIAGVDATEILLSVLRSPAIHVVATTSPEDYQQRIGSNTAVAALFERLDVAETSPETTLLILEDQAPRIEIETKVFFTMGAFLTLIELSERYLKDQPLPRKAVNLLTELGTYAQNRGERFVTLHLVQKMLSEKLAVPLGTAQGDERDKLLRLEEELHKTVVAQDEAISAIAAALRRARAGLASGKRPLASFLFLGPTGVGKTESAKALARVYFGSETRMIRLDMSEYQQTDGLARLLGTPSSTTGVKVGGTFADTVHDQPFSLILLDELEKAHPQILNLFLQVFDDGRLTDGMGRVIDFTNAIIIATSNAGAELIRTSIAAGEDQETRRTKLINYLQEQGIYRPEFLNRFDGLIAFRPLEPEHVAAIVRLMLTGLAEKLAAEQQITVSFSDDLVTAIATAGFDPQFGARPIRRLIQDTVEHHLAQKILAGELARGASLKLTADQIGLKSQV